MFLLVDFSEGNLTFKIEMRKMTYKSLLGKSLTFTLFEGSLLFTNKGTSKLEKTLNKLLSSLEEIGVSYAVTGGFCVLLYGYKRFTEDIDLLVSRDDLLKIHEKLIGKGYMRIFENSRGIRDVETGVRIEFVVAGEFPGDGKPKPVCFPEPSSVETKIKNIKVVNLKTLIELKLASGMTGGYSRSHDFKDVYELIKIHKLDKKFAKRLNPYVRQKYLEILKEASS